MAFPMSFSDQGQTQSDGEKGGYGSEGATACKLGLTATMAAAVEAQARRALPEIKRLLGVVDDVEELMVHLWLRGIEWWCSATVATAVAALGFCSRAR
jgi:hypothetical protein